MMGANKGIMEMFLMRERLTQDIAVVRLLMWLFGMARFFMALIRDLK